MMINRNYVLLVLLLLGTCFLKAAEVPVFGNYVNDYANLLGATTQAQLNQKLKDLESKTGNQVAVLILESLDFEDLEGYTTEVFSTWQIGQKGKDNGVLLFISVNDRKMRIEVGYGLEGDLTDAEAGRVIREVMTPYFKQGNYNAGVTHGLEVIVAEIEGFVGLPQAPTQTSFVWVLLVIALSFLAIVLGVFLVKRYLRNRPRRSKKTGERMFRLSEDQEDALMTEQQVFEEKIGALQYDVWVTADRGDFEVIAYHTRFSGFNTCPSCGTRAQKLTKRNTISQATYAQAGRGVEIYTCSFCEHQVEKSFTIAQKIRPQSGGVYYGGGGFGSSGGGFSGGGFSGGGFSGGGGGFSGGGGASGGW